MRKKIISFLVGLAMMLSFGLIVAQPASAQVTNISVTVTTMQCPYGGNVSRANVTIDTPGTSGSSGGATVTGLQAFQNQNNAIHGSNYCEGRVNDGWGRHHDVKYFWYWTVYRWFWANNQHTYV